MGALRQFWSQGTSSKIVVLATAGVIVIIGTISVLLIGSSLHSGNPQTGSQATNGALAGTNTPAVSSTTAGTASAGTTTPASGGPPQLGAPLAAFMTAYGQPTQQPNVQQSSNTDAFWGNAQQTVLIDVHFTNGLATNITVVGPPSSTSDQTFNACATFLPSGATSYSTSPPDTYYHSSVGDLVLENDDSGLCKLYVASS